MPIGVVEVEGFADDVVGRTRQWDIGGKEAAQDARQGGTVRHAQGHVEEAGLGPVALAATALDQLEERAGTGAEDGAARLTFQRAQSQAVAVEAQRAVEVADGEPDPPRG